MTIVNMKSFLEDLGLEKIILWADSLLEDNFYTYEFNKNLEEVADMLNSVDDEDKISGELVDIIQLTRRVAYSAIREAEDNKAGTFEKKEKAILKAQENFDEAFKKNLIKVYLLSAEVNNIVNEAYREFQISRGVAEDKIKPIDPELMKIFVDAAKKIEDEKGSIGLILDAAKIGDMLDACQYVVDAFDCINIYSDKIKYEEFCDCIFSNSPDVTSKQILFPAGTPEIKKGVLVSFLRIILYPLKFVVDYLDKKRIYGLDELRLFKDGKEKPRDEQEAAGMKQERLFDYSSVGASLKEVEVDKGEKQHYAVLDCFKGDKPPKGTIIVFHGKNADIHTKSLIDNYRSIGEGYRVIMMEYPGFEPSDGLLSKKNISKVTYQLFEDAKQNDLIKGDLTVMGDEGFGCYYAALLAKKIDEKERGSCKGLVLSESFNSTNSDLSTFGKIASYISDAEHLDTGSVLQNLPITISIAFLVSDPDSIARIYPHETQKPYHSFLMFQEDSKIPAVNYNKDPGTEISDKESQLNGMKKYLLGTLRCGIKRDEAFVYGKKPFSAFLSASASKVGDQKEQGATK